VKQNIQTLVLCGDGINSESELAHAFSLAGASAQIMHINQLLKNPQRLLDFQIFALPGGFSFGDELGSGRILALKLKQGLGQYLQEFVAQKRPIIGICNGFQALIHLGLLPQPHFKMQAGLLFNRAGHFQNRWAWLEVHAAGKSPWFLLFEENKKIILPIRHGEGRLVLTDKARQDVSAALVYTQDVNGADMNIAALTSAGGTILGMMPHPEAFLYQALSPFCQKGQELKAGDGALIFKSIVKYIQQQT